jgi:SAM-dependent methyltransferase
MSLLLELSSKMQRIFSDCVDNVVRCHPRSDSKKNLLMGFTMEQISKQILVKGLADFSAGFSHPSGDLSPEELVSLYCYANMKKHFFTCQATFQEHRKAIEELYKPEGRPLIIDFGCGPATACLALADLFPNRMMDYIGIDAALAMRARASAFCDVAKRDSLLIKEGSRVQFQKCWDEIPIDNIRGECSVMLVFSYFFASMSITTQDVRGLATWIAKLAGKRTRRPLALFYMNSTDARANEKYYMLKRSLGQPQHELQTKQVEYQTYKSGPYPKKSVYVSEFLRLNSVHEATRVTEDNLILF